MKFILSYLRYFGILFLFLFSVFHILIGPILSELDKDSLISKTFSYVNHFENQLYDYRMKNDLSNRKASKEIVLLAIDDRSLKDIGRWPWSRRKHAQILYRLKEFGAKVVAFDVFFSETQEIYKGKTSPDKLLSKSIHHFQKGRDAHVALIYSIEERSFYQPEIHYEFFPDALLAQLLDGEQGGDFGTLPQAVKKTEFPIEIIQKAMPQYGYAQNEMDSDGVFRRYPFIANIGDGIYVPSMGLLAYQSFSGDRPSFRVETSSGGVRGVLKLKDKGELFFGSRGEAKVRFSGGPEKFAQLSATDLLNAKKNDPKLIKLLADKLVFIGSIAEGAHDLRNSPIDPNLPGVYYHMNTAQMLLNQFFFKPINESLGYSLILLALSFLLSLGIHFFHNAIADFIGLIISVIAILWIDSTYFVPQGYELKLFSCFLGLFLFYVWDTALNFLEANKEKAQIKGTFSHYVAPAIVNEMLKNPEKLKVGGEKRDITCLFSDVRDFTAISEKLSPEDLSSCLNEYMGAMTDIVFDNKGTLDKYIGDAIVAFWGAPLDVENHPHHAVSSAVKMINALPELNKNFKHKNFPEFKIGIGLNSGECAVGNMGSEQIFSYTALGDNMNLGARLEGLCKIYGAQIIISEYTQARIDENIFPGRILDKVQVKGKEKPVEIYEIFHHEHYYFQHPDVLETYHAAYDLYLNKNFIEAAELFQRILHRNPADASAKRFLQVIQNYLKTPPGEGWTGVTVYQVK